MMAWLSANLINIVLIAVLALITGLLIYSMIRSKKQGKSSCGAAAPRAVPVTDAVYTLRTVRYDP